MQLWANLAAMLERLDDEWTNSLKVGERTMRAREGRGRRVARRPPPTPHPTQPFTCCTANPSSPLPQALDPHANVYMERLKDETILLALAQKVGAAGLGRRWQKRVAPPPPPPRLHTHTRSLGTWRLRLHTRKVKCQTASRPCPPTANPQPCRCPHTSRRTARPPSRLPWRCAASTTFTTRRVCACVKGLVW